MEKVNLDEINWDVCSYCKKTKDEVELKFSWMKGSICVNCSDKWHKDYPKALSKGNINVYLKLWKK